METENDLSEKDMENQNSAEQEKKKFFNLHGKKKKVLIIVIAVLLLFNLAARGLGLRDGSGAGGRGHSLAGTGNVILAAKDFEPLGIVFAESTAPRRDGRGLTYNALMREAAEKGADAIINVSISSTRGFFNRTWSGSALAIKFLDAVPGETNITTAFFQARRGRGFGRTGF